MLNQKQNKDNVSMKGDRESSNLKINIDVKINLNWK